MQHVPDSRIKDLCVKYAELEMTLGEIDRARGIFRQTNLFQVLYTVTAYCKYTRALTFERF
jgi:hypothetical protein